MNVSSLRRNIKNLAHNYTHAQVKVREATSNDPWGPSSTLMSEIADLTYNVMAFTEIMQMIWKRLNDHGKNWRHVYKALVLLEYLIKTGSEKVGQQCKENIYAIQTLKDFQHYEENKDQGINVREKAKQLVNLLKDEERLKNERAKALKAKERFAQTASGFGSDGAMYPDAWKGLHERPVSHDLTSKELENARPQTVGEEELQLQLALAMSREEAEQEEQRRKSDDVRLQLALSQSQHEFKANTSPQNNSHVLDLLDVNLSGTSSGAQEPTFDPWGMQVPPPPQKAQVDPWCSSTSSASKTSPTATVDPWAPIQTEPRSSVTGRSPNPVTNDPWKSVSPVPKPQTVDPWSPNTYNSSPQLSSPNNLDDFDFIANRDKPSSNTDNVTNNNGN
ncbi:Epsin-1, putative [Pediculus humanus corporis]|uniref:Epsin-1, putative n=1 Tax=Pediculus humanus subsp. corporis TaxID=121224 RepID=E0VCB2_PEDHC|nr:Epsin-1, putative [Pediculus humanus corporis]EEB10998.1 Epsin-1, putative [Pediculus humanus corporis]